MDYSEALTVVDDALKRLRDSLPRGRWNEAKQLALLADQHLLALVEECKRKEREQKAGPTEDEANWYLPDKPRYFEDFT